ncbi:MAG: glycosyltransferase family 2 protein [Flavobacteriales bacterium]|nr:glycosyltransferase family 2 protein [Flavobacteriales bacterium]MBK6945276.1 glycosyltransferase family 2 protein [Flavobacteriales bacterium]MBK7239627.1 glycosyltransferase family 2 protein [Flavobacteriales bacterium]MBK9535167.1 glycosyltransferase family 2 protein [Flavobacteriales bacterium]MBP9137857.1 glycosyltransferase family 2 protein [Flavobacteriales bacterium]
MNKAQANKEIEGQDEIAPVLSFIVVSYNTRDILGNCLASIQAHVTRSYEVIVIDNASSDGSPELVGSDHSNVVLIRSDVNLGFSAANNLGMERAKGKYLILLNSDTVITPNSIGTWLDAHELANATISGPTLVYLNGSQQTSAWKVPRPLDSALEAVFLHRLFGRRGYPMEIPKEGREVGFISGAAMLFHRSVFLELGGLDPILFWMEDVDLCVRITRGGGTCWQFRTPPIIHIGGQSSAKEPSRMISNQLISRIKFTRKHRNGIASFVVARSVYIQVITRILGFGFISLFRNEPRAKAYRYTFGKLNRYLFQSDTSI